MSLNSDLLVWCVARFVARRISLISDSINVLRRAPRRVTIRLHFRLFKVWPRLVARRFVLKLV
jgi:hypothetical protein